MQKISCKNMVALLCAAIGLVFFVSAANAAPIGKVLSVSGTLEVGKKGGAKTVPIKAGDDIEMSDNLKTLSGSSAVIMLDDGTKLFLGESAKARVSYYAFKGEDEKRNVEIKVFYGKVGIIALNIIKVFADGKKTWRDLSFVVLTPTAELKTSGAVFTVEVSANGTTKVGTSSGIVSVKNIKGSVVGEYKVGENLGVTVKRDSPPTEPREVSDASFNEFFGKTPDSSEANSDGGADVEATPAVEAAPQQEEAAPAETVPVQETTPDVEAAPNQ